MSISGTFGPVAFGPVHNPAIAERKRKDPPFSLRLSLEERTRLESDAAGAPLGAYIKGKLFGDALSIRVRRSGLPVEDRKALAQALALLGRSNVANNLNQLAKLAHIGALPLTRETEAELTAALADIRYVRRLLLEALGLKPERAP
jgi:hypothetical protein